MRTTADSFFYCVMKGRVHVAFAELLHCFAEFSPHFAELLHCFAEFPPHSAEFSPHSAEFSPHFAESSPHSAELPLRFAEFFLHYEERSATSETPFRSRSPCPLFIQLLLKILLMVSNARIIWFIVQCFCIVLIGIFVKP